MSDLNNEIHRTMLLNSLRNASPQLLREILSASPDEARVTAGLKKHNDELHSHLREVSEVAPDPGTSSNVEHPQPRRPRRFEAFSEANNRAAELFKNGLK